jgi:hypothetical protein
MAWYGLQGRLIASLRCTRACCGMPVWLGSLREGRASAFWVIFGSGHGEKGDRWRGLVRAGCTPVFACGYGTGVGRSAVAAAGGVNGFDAALRGVIGRAGPVRGMAGLVKQASAGGLGGPGVTWGGVAA